jgi:acyl-CoA thioesterase-1
VLILGDSLSAGYGIDVAQAWPRLLARRLAHQGYPHAIVNASISGETTRGGLARLGALLDRYRPVIGVIELGANDGLRGIPVDEIKSNLSRMIAMMKAAGATPVLVKMRLPPNYGPKYSQRFEALYDGLRSDADAVVAPFILEGIATRPELMQDDGLHPNAAAQPLIVDNIWPVLQPLLEEPTTARSD